MSADKLTELARSLPYDEPSDTRMDELRRSISLAAPAPRAAPRLAFLGAALAGAAAALLVATLVIPRATPPHPLRGRVSPEPGARFEHLVSPTPAPAWSEVVVLAQGGAWFDVDRLGPGESFRVLAGDGVVEVKGTRFRCYVEAGKLLAVEVERGRVELRVSGEAPLLLGPGDRWSPSASGTLAPAAPTPKLTPAPAIARRHVARALVPPAPDPASPPVTAAEPEPAPVEPPSPPPLRPEERAFSEGWNALRSGDAGTAASRFAAIPAGDPLGEDAAYWGLVARTRLGAKPEAELRSFLDRFPDSPRRGEVQLMLGLRLLASGDESGARLSLRAAAADPSPRVSKAAREALDSLSPSADPAGP